MRKVEQVRYYQHKDDRNQPKNITMNRFVSGNVFAGKYPIVQLGIQTLPGVKFYLNNSTSPIVIGYTGIYDIELNGLTEITHLRFDAESMNLIDANRDSYLIVDFIYEAQEEDV